LRGHPNILERLLIHASAFNPGLLMRQLIGVGAPRRLQGRPLDLGALEIARAILYEGLWEPATALLVSSLRAPVVRLVQLCRVSRRVIGRLTVTTDC